MPEFDMRYIKIGKYVNTAGTVSYTNVTRLGDAMEGNIELKFAEGRLYAEGGLAEYLKRCTGGTVSYGVKYILPEAKKLMYGFAASSRQITVGGTQKTVDGLKYTKDSAGAYVGNAFFAPDVVDGVEKFTCVFVAKAMFGPPAMKFKTMDGGTITFQTPTTTGEFLATDDKGLLLIETATVDTPEEAVAWVDACLPNA